MRVTVASVLLVLLAGAAGPQDRVVPMLGATVRGSDDKDVGRIVDVLVNAAGQPEVAILDVGGFLGVGNRRVAVEWSALRFRIEDAGAPVVSLTLPSADVKAAPDYTPDKPVEPMMVAPHEAPARSTGTASPPPAAQAPPAADTQPP